MAQIDWSVTLQSPIEIEGQIYKEIGFRDFKTQDVTEGKVTYGQIETVQKNIGDISAISGGDLDRMVCFSASLMRNLAVSPKLKSHEGLVRVDDAQIIMTSFLKRLGEIAEKTQEIAEKEFKGVSDAPSPLPLSTPKGLDAPLEKSAQQPINNTGT